MSPSAFAAYLDQLSCADVKTKLIEMYNATQLASQLLNGEIKRQTNYQTSASFTKPNPQIFSSSKNDTQPSGLPLNVQNGVYFAFLGANLPTTLRIYSDGTVGDVYGALTGKWKILGSYLRSGTSNFLVQNSGLSLLDVTGSNSLLHFVPSAPLLLDSPYKGGTNPNGYPQTATFQSNGNMVDANGQIFPFTQDFIDGVWTVKFGSGPGTNPYISCWSFGPSVYCSGANSGSYPFPVRLTNSITE